MYTANKKANRLLLKIIALVWFEIAMKGAISCFVCMYVYMYIYNIYTHRYIYRERGVITLCQ